LAHAFCEQSSPKKPGRQRQRARGPTSSPSAHGAGGGAGGDGDGGRRKSAWPTVHGGGGGGIGGSSHTPRVGPPHASGHAWATAQSTPV